MTTNKHRIYLSAIIPSHTHLTPHTVTIIFFSSAFRHPNSQDGTAAFQEAHGGMSASGSPQKKLGRFEVKNVRPELLAAKQVRPSDRPSMRPYVRASVHASRQCVLVGESKGTCVCAPSHPPVPRRIHSYPRPEARRPTARWTGVEWTGLDAHREGGRQLRY